MEGLYHLPGAWASLRAERTSSATGRSPVRWSDWFGFFLLFRTESNDLLALVVDPQNSRRSARVEVKKVP